jgi:predicted transcriptional regulator
MDTPDTPAPEPANRAQEAMELQRGWYGEPLGDLFRRLITALGLNNQVRLAGVLGLSAPMLSQLMSGQRAKIGNPVVVQRLQMLQELAWEVTEGTTGAMEAAARMDRIRTAAGTSVLSTTHSGAQRTAAATSREIVHGIQTVTRSPTRPVPSRPPTPNWQSFSVSTARGGPATPSTTSRHTRTDAPGRLTTGGRAAHDG